MLLYAVGDIHGRADLLEALLSSIAEDVRASGVRPTVVFLGDYVDRGPDSRAVVSRLHQLSQNPALDLVCLRGNHEQTLLDFLGDASVGPTWIDYGGGPTLQSYGVSAPRVRTDAEGWEKARADFARALPEQELRWMARFPTLVEYGDYAFVHAGVRPGVPLADQADEDLLWIREAFVQFTGRHEKVIVHGHTPADEAHVGRWRINLDTGAYATGKLTALRLQGSDRRLLQTRP